jgi:hypothetical protein
MRRNRCCVRVWCVVSVKGVYEKKGVLCERLIVREEVFEE